jgi:hypothetical protein
MVTQRRKTVRQRHAHEGVSFITVPFCSSQKRLPAPVATCVTRVDDVANVVGAPPARGTSITTPFTPPSVEYSGPSDQ